MKYVSTVTIATKTGDLKYLYASKEKYVNDTNNVECNKHQQVQGVLKDTLPF